MFLDIQIKKVITVISARGCETPGRKPKKEIKKPKKKKRKRKEKEKKKRQLSLLVPVHNLIKPLSRPFRDFSRYEYN